MPFANVLSAAKEMHEKKHTQSNLRKLYRSFVSATLNASKQKILTGFFVGGPATTVFIAGPFQPLSHMCASQHYSMCVCEKHINPIVRFVLSCLKWKPLFEPRFELCTEKCEWRVGVCVKTTIFWFINIWLPKFFKGTRAVCSFGTFAFVEKAN